jgi:ABC-2 type transport system ATP-binding protein
VAIINQGKVLACDTPEVLNAASKANPSFCSSQPLNGHGVESFEALPGVVKAVHHSKDGFSELEFILEEEQVLGSVINTMTAEDIRILHLQKCEPTLEDVFVQLVGQSMEEVELSEKSE